MKFSLNICFIWILLALSACVSSSQNTPLESNPETQPGSTKMVNETAELVTEKSPTPTDTEPLPTPTELEEEITFTKTIARIRRDRGINLLKPVMEAMLS